jgi:hypothetical protein
VGNAVAGASTSSTLSSSEGRIRTSSGTSLAARELAAACQAGTARPGDIAAALENLTEIHDYLVEDRRPL